MNEERILAEDATMKRVMGMDILNYPRAGKCAIQALDIALTEVGVGDDLRKKLVDLSEKAVTRRIEKAYQEEGNIRIELEMSLVSENGKIRITVQDEGIPYMVQESLADVDDAMLRNENNALLGEDATLYQEFQVHTEKMGRSGQCFVIEAPFTYIQGVIEPAKRKFDVLDSDFNIHKVTNNLVEINEAIYCIFHEYQYTYAYEDLYKLDTFQQLVESELLHSYLVVNNHKQVAGHFGLSESSVLPNMPEICTVVIKVEFRKLHFGSKIFAYAVEEAKRMKKPAMWAQPTAFHTGTQNICNKLDFVPTGFLFQYVNKDIKANIIRKVED